MEGGGEAVAGDIGETVIPDGCGGGLVVEVVEEWIGPDRFGL